MTRRKRNFVMSALAIAALAMLVVPASGSTIEYSFWANGQDLTGVTITPDNAATYGITVGSPFLLDIYAVVKDNVYHDWNGAPDYGSPAGTGGILQATFNIEDSTGIGAGTALTPLPVGAAWYSQRPVPAGEPQFENINPFGPNTYVPMLKVENSGYVDTTIDGTGYDVYQYVANRAQSFWKERGTQSATQNYPDGAPYVGGQAGDLTTGIAAMVGQGGFTWDGTDGSLTLTAPAADNLVYSDSPEGLTKNHSLAVDSIVGASLVFAADGGGGTDTPYTVSIVGDALGATDYTIDFRTAAGNESTTLTGVIDTAGSPTTTPQWAIQAQDGSWVTYDGLTKVVDRTLLESLGYPYNPDPGTPISIAVEFSADNGVAGGSPTASGTLTYVPEPGSVMMLLSGLIGMALCWWRRR